MNETGLLGLKYSDKIIII